MAGSRRISGARGGPAAALALAGLVGLGAPAAGGAEPGCGRTFAPITVNGEFDDWQLVLANPLNTVSDADGTSLACGVSPDRDCPVPGGHVDLRTFAYTWDATNLYVYVERYLGTEDSAEVYVYLDREDEQLYDGDVSPDGDILLRFKWKPRLPLWDLDAKLSVFDSVGVIEDMLDPVRADCGPSGTERCADGHAFGDTVDTFDKLLDADCPDSACARALRFEYAVPWTAFGLRPGQPMSFHVSTALGAPARTWHSPAELLDNMGGRLGGPGSTAFRCHRLLQDQELAGAENVALLAPHVVTNLGNVDNSYRLFATSPSGFELRFFTDPNRDGDPSDGVEFAFDAEGDGDFSSANDVIAPGWDRDGDGFPETPVVLGGPGFTAGASFYFVVVVGPDGPRQPPRQERIAVHAACTGTGQDESVVDVLHFGQLTLLPNRQASAPPDTVVGYAHELRNPGVADRDVADILMSSSQGWATAAYTDPNCDGDRSDGALVAPFIVPGGATVCLVAEVAIPPGAALGTVDFMTVTVDGSGRDDSVLDTTTVQAGLLLEPDHLLSNGRAKYGAPGSTVYYAHRLSNNTDGPKTYSLSYLSMLGFSASIYTDPDRDGNPTDGVRIPDGGSTRPVAGRGGTLGLVLAVDVGPVPIGSIERTEFIAIENGGVNFVQVADETVVSQVATFEDPLHAVQRTSFEPCSTIHALGTGLTPSLAERYLWSWRDPSGTEVRRTVASSDLASESPDALSLDSLSEAGAWTLDLFTCSAAYDASAICPGAESLVEERTIQVEHGAQVDVLTTDQTSYVLGEDLAIRVAYSNASAVSALSGTRLRIIVLTPDESQHAMLDGSFAPWGPGLSTDVIEPLDLAPGEIGVRDLVIPAPSFPVEAPGYAVRVIWEADCGAQLLDAQTSFAVGAPGEDCANGTDDDGDGAVDCDDSDCATDPACFEGDCANGLDDDGDGAVDCDDSDCATDPACFEGDCANGLDDDGDGAVDCDDSDCLTSPDCASSGLAINRAVRLGPGGPMPPVGDQFGPPSPWRLIPEEVRAEPLTGLRLVGEALPSGSASLWLYEHADPVTTMKVSREGDDLVFAAN